MSIAFVTGLTGCIGSSTTAYLLDHGVDQVVGFSRHEDWSRISEALNDQHPSCLSRQVSRTI